MAMTSGEVVFFIVFIGVILVFSFLAWGGFGRWLMGKAGVENPPRKWWFWWRAIWVYMIVAAVLTEFGDANLDPPSGGLMLVLYWLMVVTGVSVGLGSFVAAVVFAIREFRYRVRDRATNQSES